MISSHPYFALVIASVVIPFFVLSIVLRHFSRGGERDRLVVFARQWYLLTLVPIVWFAVAWALIPDRADLWDDLGSHNLGLTIALPPALFAWMFSYYAWLWIGITTASTPANLAGERNVARRKIAILLSSAIAIAGSIATIGLHIAALVVDTRDITNVSREQTIFRLIGGVLLLFFAWGLSMGWADGSAEYGRRDRRYAQSGTSVAADPVPAQRGTMVSHLASQLVSFGFAGSGLIILYLTARSIF